MIVSKLTLSCSQKSKTIIMNYYVIWWNVNEIFAIIYSASKEPGGEKYFLFDKSEDNSHVRVNIICFNLISLKKGFGNKDMPLCLLMIHTCHGFRKIVIRACYRNDKRIRVHQPEFVYKSIIVFAPSDRSVHGFITWFRCKSELAFTELIVWPEVDSQ